MAIERAGEKFSGYNKPKNSRKGGKKFAVLAKDKGKVKDPVCGTSGGLTLF